MVNRQWIVGMSSIVTVLMDNRNETINLNGHNYDWT